MEVRHVLRLRLIGVILLITAVLWWKFGDYDKDKPLIEIVFAMAAGLFLIAFLKGMIKKPAKSRIKVFCYSGT